LATLAAAVLPASLHAATVPGTVTINSVLNISAGNGFWGAPDLHAQIWIEGVKLRTPTVFSSQGFTSPAGWTFTRPVSRAKRGKALVRIELRDNDWRLPDPLVDIDMAPCPGRGAHGRGETQGRGGKPVE